MEVDYAQICKNEGVYTRIVYCSFYADYDENSQIYEEEFMRIGTQTDKFEYLLENLRSRKGGDENETLVRILAQIYHKLENLENLIKEKENFYLPLKFRGNVVALGHSIICMENADFKVGKTYYIRFTLPTLPECVVSVIAQALNSGVVKIIQMHPKNMKDFDMYIAIKEMENLRIKKTKKEGQNDVI